VDMRQVSVLSISLRRSLRQPFVKRCRLTLFAPTYSSRKAAGHH
jgi:hypothetical protein